ncbi:MAG: NAD(P)/FAD-dependent oxidoreductase [Xenococcaceae cyanobacterium MO_188.B32]|nr:NAD(P)/FAD-dependent oxidoreductase [Xenococcaceae cyanobacterium MO_188.B32]
MNNEPIKICILGGGFGGLYTALYLADFSWLKSGKCQITLVEPKNNFLFTPLLYEILTGELQRWEIAPSYQKLLAGKKIDLRQDKAKGVDLDNRQVQLEQGSSLVYDYLVLAVGQKTRWIDIPGLAAHALTFRSIFDAENLQERLRLLEASGRQKLRVAVVGAGPNGVELACKVSDRLSPRAEVIIIDRGAEILRNFAKGVKKAAYQAIKNRNIQVYLESGLKEITQEQITFFCNDNLIDYPVDLVLWTAGTENIDWVANLNCQQNNQGRILVHPTLQLIDYREVFAVGDIAEIRQSKTQIVPATAQAAYQQASLLAKNLKLTLQGKSLKHFRYLHLGDMLTLGKGVAIVSSFGINLTGSLAGLIRRLIYIFRLPTFRHRWQVLKNLLHLK